MAVSKYSRPLFAWCVTVLVAVAPRSASAQALHVVDDGADEVVGSLLSRGLTVSFRLPGASFVFGGPEVTAAAAQLGRTSWVVDAVAGGWDHYLVRSETPGLALLPPECRVMPAVGDVWVVAVPTGRTELVLGLGHEFVRLYPRPLRMPRSGLRPAARTRIASEADIAALVARVSAESLGSNVFWLEAFGTRNARKAGCQQAAEWLAARFRGFGIAQVEIRAWTSEYAGNVVATLPGTEHPNDVFLLGGHYDSIVHDGGDFEPGADDNASGTATLLEIARLLATQRLASTVRIVAFGAEEYGLVGSEVYASQAAMEGENIVGMLNFDMLGYLAPGDKPDLDIIPNDQNSASDWLMQAAFDAAALYVPGLRTLRGKLSWGRSDHMSFWAHGYDAVFFFEDSSSPSPFIHTPDDIIGVSYNDSTLHVRATRVALATVATLAGAQPVAVTLQSFAAERQGAGVRLAWSLAGDPWQDLAGIAVERAASQPGAWRERAMLAREATEFVDASVAVDEPVWYRLVLVRAGGVRLALPALEVAPGRLRTGIAAVYETAGQGDVHVRYRLGVATPRLHLGVYDVRGRLRRLLIDAPGAPGEYLHNWDRRDGDGRPVANGVYVVHLRSTDASASRKVVLVGR